MPDAPTILDNIVIAVHPSAELAAAQRERISDRLAFALDSAGAALNIGEDRRVISGGDLDAGGTLWFRRANVTVVLSWARAASGAFSLAEKVDAAIRDDREIAPIGVFSEQPDIESTGTLSPLSADLKQPIAPTAIGLGPADKIRFHVEAVDGPAKVEPVGSQAFVVSKRVPSSSRADIERCTRTPKIRVYAAGRRNVFVSKVFTLSVAP